MRITAIGSAVNGTSVAAGTMQHGKILACAEALGTGHARPEKNHGEVRAQLRRARGGVRREHEGGGFERQWRTSIYRSSLRLSASTLSVTETSRSEIFFTPPHIKLATDSHHHPPSIPRHATSFPHVSFATRCRESACFHPKSRGAPSFLLFLTCTDRRGGGVGDQ